MLLEAVLLFFPMLVGVIYAENNLIQFLLPALGLVALGLPLSLIPVKDKAIFVKEGFVIVAFSWIILSLVGAVPFVVSGEIPNYVDALFETVSGFSTTGASIMSDVEILSKASMFWRLFTHWIGGMGVLVFVLAILPATSAGSMHVFRAESPGPTAQKLVSKLSYTARILYLIYGGMTVITVIFLLCGGLPFYDALLYSFSVAGTGGFAITNSGISAYNSVYVEMVIAVFMFLFAVSFNVYYLILIGQVKKAFKSEELKTYSIIVVVATVFITLNILTTIGSLGEALRYALFQVTSISSTTGLSTFDFNTWPTFSKAILIMLTVIGASAGSTGGGLKVSRLIILVKSAFKDIKRMIYPRSVVSISFENQPVQRDTERGIRTYFIVWAFIVVCCVFLLSIDGVANAWISGQGFSEIATHISATLACIGNVGPGIEAVGPTMNYAMYSPLSKILLSFVMLVGRLEIFPMIILFAPRTWKRG